MAKSLRDFRTVLLAGWIALGAAGILYARSKGIPHWAAFPVLAAFLITYPFYLVPAFRELRERLSGYPLLAYLMASAVLPYLACCCGAVRFHWEGLARLVVMALVFGLWYLVLPAKPLADLGFLALIPAVLLGKYLNAIYLPLYPALKDAIILGHLSLIEISVMVLLLVRRVKESGYRFLPGWREWGNGFLYFLFFAALAFPLGVEQKILHVAPAPAPWWRIAATFFGVLWVLALSEEFFCRGVLQQWLEDWTQNRTAALLIASAVFGLMHLGFGGRFPNWPWVAGATMLGLACGRARNDAGSFRAGMVTHALAVTFWRAFYT
ncbi:MAG TPA: CPBP family intramembrane glutamic endopeptidase [Bryobacteraceae bacterium]|nr:CPBP family intramembrane glutamic endopeptidase [Bryobacteraceae bacterium]